jgi:hypothetical protein
LGASVLALNNGISVSVEYRAHSTASGVLFSFVYISGDDVDFNRSLLLTVDKKTSQNNTLPFDFYSGHYRIYIYDIEYDGTLFNGEVYPALKAIELNTTGNREGRFYYSRIGRVSDNQLSFSL